MHSLAGKGEVEAGLSWRVGGEGGGVRGVGRGMRRVLRGE